MSDQRRLSAKRFVAAVSRSVPLPLAPPDSHDPAEVAAMLREIGIALLEVHQPTQLVEGRLTQIAARYTTEPVRAVVLPTVLTIQVGGLAYEVETSTNSSLQLDVAGRVDDVARLAAEGAIAPADAVAAIQRARTLKPRFGPIATTLGYAVATVGFGMVVYPTWASLPAYLFLGLVVGAIVQISRPFPPLAPVLPVVAAMTATVLATWFVADTAHDGLLRVITPALVAMLPGISLTVSAVELAGGQIISGSSRLVYAVAQLGLLVFGAAQGLHFARRMPAQSPAAHMGFWSLYVATVVVAVGLYFYLSAPRGSLPWLIAAIGVALIAQALAGKVMPDSHTGFVGALLVVPFAMLAARIKTSPPPIVMMLAAFWALVPGALSFESVDQAIAGRGSIAGLAVAGSAVLSIALGTLVGWSIYQAIDGRLSRSAVRDIAKVDAREI
jgi:uncharacterized membrane protein YjjP (DUF1212 family)